MRVKRLAQTLAVFCATLALVFVAILANVYRHANIDQTTAADVIIVLGASQWDGMPSPIFRARLEHAYDLYSAGYASHVILTGGFGEEDAFSESNVGKMYLAKRGVPLSAMSIEEASHTTQQSLSETARIISERGYNSALLVSHDFHMMRAQKMARDLGFVVFASPVETQSAAQKLRYSAREVWVYALYRVFGV